MKPLARITPATLDALSVLVNETDPVWGLRIIKETGRPAGSIYPILDRLEQKGWVTSTWEEDSQRKGPRRRLYTLTTQGRTAAQEALAKATQAQPSRPSPSFGRRATA